MLLTSGQVSVAVSSGIVFLCTAALFLSGYVLQQRTLRDLRAAIKQPPRPSPKIFLPDRFKQSTTELADGTVVALDENGLPLSEGEGEGEREGAQRGGKQQQQQQQQQRVVVVEVEVRPTLPDDVRLAKAGGGGGSGGVLPGDEPTKTNVEGKKAKGKGSGGAAAAAASGKDGEDGPQKPMSRAERRRRIKEEIQKSAQGERGYFRRLGCGEGGKC